ncbi:hypothetical protein QCA50_018932 [Cerrena zonata]|uniref:DUF7918 domain-containing protein n=1 Tax=Cerrena zonata TaxID=2478898 RepID=A0AAW0FGU2_9APHY
MKLNNFEVYVQADGENLPEYQVKLEQGSKTTTCFIPSQSGKKFEIRWKSSINEEATVQCRIDGRHMGSSMTQRHGSSSRFGVRVSPTQRLPYVFSDLVLVDDENVMIDNSVLSKLGTIEVIVTRAIRLPSNNSAINWHPHVPNNIGPLHEKSKKVGGHCVSLGKPVTCAPDPRSRSKPLYPGEGHWAKFVFQYRPQALLRAQGIAEPSNNTQVSQLPKLKRPRSPSLPLPKPELSTNTRSSSTASDSHRPSKKVKREFIDLTLVKDEEPPRLLDPSLHGTVIDLTLDDD